MERDHRGGRRKQAGKVRMIVEVEQQSHDKLVEVSQVDDEERRTAIWTGNCKKVEQETRLLQYWHNHTFADPILDGCLKIELTRVGKEQEAPTLTSNETPSRQWWLEGREPLPNWEQTGQAAHCS